MPPPKKYRHRRRWMRVRDAEILKSYVTQPQHGYARTARYADCSRQFIWQLAHGQKATCSDEVGERVEEMAGVLPGTLFVREGSRVERRTVRAVTTLARTA
jgi:hypothetical protein